MIAAGVILGGGGVAGWLAPRLSAARRERDALEIELEAAERSRDEVAQSGHQRIADLREAYEARLQDAALSAEHMRLQLEALLPQVADRVLSARSEQWHQSARQELQQSGQATVSRVRESQLHMENLLQGMQQQLMQYQERLNALENERAQAEVRIEQQLQDVARAGGLLAQEARTLREAIQTSGGVRGRWGEAVLKNLLDLAGLNEHVDYDLQVTLNERESLLRPDAILHLPSGRDLIVDAKASLTSFLGGLSEPDEQRRQELFRQFAAVLRRRADELAGKDYSGNLDNSIPCVIMFVPSEAAFRAALDADPELFLHGQSKRPSVLLASPSTLLPLVSVITQGWQQHIMNRQAAELAAEVNEFARRLAVFLGHVQKIARGLDSASDAYDKAIASFRSRLTPKIERLKEMGAAFDTLPELRPVERRAGLEPEAVADPEINGERSIEEGAGTL